MNNLNDVRNYPTPKKNGNFNKRNAGVTESTQALINNMLDAGFTPYNPNKEVKRSIRK